MNLAYKITEKKKIESSQNWKIPGGFSQHPRFLLHYYRNLVGALLVIDLSLIALRPGAFSAFELHLSWWSLPFVLLGLYLGALSGVFIHNASHGSFRSKALSRLMGELAGVHQLYGFMSWKLAHIVHHKFPDDPALDPHPPAGHRNAFLYGLSLTPAVRKSLVQFHRIQFGESTENSRIWLQNDLLVAATVVLSALFWFMLLGPRLFVLLYLPSYFGTQALMTYLNFHAHKTHPDGRVEILDFDGGIYTFLNQILFGVFYHKTHHLRASHFNPKKICAVALKSPIQEQ